MILFKNMIVAISAGLVTPVAGYSISIDRSGIQSDDLGPYYEEIIEIRGQNNKALVESQLERARDAGYEAACKPGEGKLLDRANFSDGVVTLEMVCSVVDS